MGYAIGTIGAGADPVKINRPVLNYNDGPFQAYGSQSAPVTLPKTTRPVFSYNDGPAQAFGINPTIQELPTLRPSVGDSNFLNMVTELFPIGRPTDGMYEVTPSLPNPVIPEAPVYDGNSNDMLTGIANMAGALLNYNGASTDEVSVYPVSADRREFPGGLDMATLAMFGAIGFAVFMLVKS